MINEIPDYGPPRHYLNKWTADQIKDLAIRCCTCGAKLRDDTSNLCGVCERATVIQGD